MNYSGEQIIFKLGAKYQMVNERRLLDGSLSDSLGKYERDLLVTISLTIHIRQYQGSCVVQREDAEDCVIVIAYGGRSTPATPPSQLCLMHVPTR